jgi:hypothetical protein
LRLLADQILATPTVARLWWLEGKPGRLEDLVAKGKDEMFEKISELLACLPSARPPTPLRNWYNCFSKVLMPGSVNS